MASPDGKPHLKEGEEETLLAKVVFLIYRFLVKGDGPIPFLREIVGSLVVVGIILAALWGGTGQSFPDEAPVVVVESGSMMHCTNGVGSPSATCVGESFGRVGTIDPGDLVFVKAVDGKDDVETYAAGGKVRHGYSGDVIVYHKNGDDKQTPIIHRAMFWLQIHGDGTYSVPELGIHRRSDLNHPRLTSDEYGLGSDYHKVLERNNAGPEDSGYVTRGDNNQKADQPGISQMPIQPDWILGKARGEVPWMGLIKLRVSDFTSGTNFYADAPKDLRQILIGVVVLLVAIPFAIEMAFKLRRNRPQVEDVTKDPRKKPHAAKTEGKRAEKGQPDPETGDGAGDEYVVVYTGDEDDDDELMSFNPPSKTGAKESDAKSTEPPNSPGQTPAKKGQDDGDGDDDSEWAPSST